MTQTENYVILKPISERFSRIANEITDEELKYIIVSTLRQQVEQKVNFTDIVAICDAYVDDHEDDIKEWTEEAIKNRLKKLEGGI